MKKGYTDTRRKDRLGERSIRLSNKELVKKYNCSNDIIATRKYQFKKGMMNYE